MFRITRNNDSLLIIEQNQSEIYKSKRRVYKCGEHELETRSHLLSTNNNYNKISPFYLSILLHPLPSQMLLGSLSTDSLSVAIKNLPRNSLSDLIYVTKKYRN